MLNINEANKFFKCKYWITCLRTPTLWIITSKQRRRFFFQIWEGEGDKKKTLMYPNDNKLLNNQPLHWNNLPMTSKNFDTKKETDPYANKRWCQVDSDKLLTPNRRWNLSLTENDISINRLFKLKSLLNNILTTWKAFLISSRVESLDTPRIS